MNSCNVSIRSEEPGDEEMIDTVNCSAFGEMNEAYIVRLMRSHYPQYDPRYSVTAWDGSDLIGHALFSPSRIRFMGKTISALAVGPVAVVPEKQKQGVGRKMLEFGHALGRAEGFELAYLNGFPAYYSKWGYQGCFGFAKVTINLDVLPEPSCKLTPKPVRPADIPWLVSCFTREWADVDFSWQWGNNLSAWTMPGVNSVIWWTADGRRAAYTLCAPDKKWQMVLADDVALARHVISRTKPDTLDQHPAGWLVRNLLPIDWATSEINPSSAAMAYELQEGVLEPYLEAVKSGKRLPGFCSWPLPFILC